MMDELKAKSPASKYARVLGFSVLKRELYLGVVLVLLVLIVLLIVVSAVLKQNPEASGSKASNLQSTNQPDRSWSKASEAAQRVLAGQNQLTPLRQLLEAHIQATGLDQIKAYIAEGTFGSVADDQKIILMARAPDFLRYRTEYSKRGLVVEFGHSAAGTWLKQSREVMNPSRAEFFKSVALLEASLTHVAWAYLSSDALEDGVNSVLELLPSDEPGCAIVRSRGLLPMPIDHYIDTETYQETYRRATMRNEDGVEVQVSLDFDPVEDSAPCRFPVGYQLYLDGRLVDTVKYTKLRMNQFMLSPLFEAPLDNSVSD
jgi:hypothetical protein